MDRADHLSHVELGSVFAFRAWSIKVDQDGMQLGPMFRKSVPFWQPGVNEAVCGSESMYEWAVRSCGLASSKHQMHGQGDVPSWYCVCGFYGFSDPYREHNQHLHGLAVYRRLAGIFEGWGPTIFHEHGVKTRYARVVALAIPTTYDNPRMVRCQCNPCIDQAIMEEYYYKTDQENANNPLIRQIDYTAFVNRALVELGNKFDVPAFENYDDMIDWHLSHNTTDRPH